MAEALRHRESGAVAAALRQRLAAGREDDRRGAQIAPIRDDAEASGGSLDVEHTVTRDERRADGVGFTQERVEHVAGAVRVGKQLAAGFLVQCDADLAEEVDRIGHRERAKDAADDRRTPAPEIALGDDGVRHVAARSAADENLGARLSGALEDHDRTRWVEAAKEDGRRKAGGAGADDGDVAGLRRCAHAEGPGSQAVPA